VNTSTKSSWLRAYEPVFESFQTPSQKNSFGFLGSTILKIHAMSARIMLAGAFFSTEIGYDEHLTEFKEIYSLAESIYEPLITSVRDKVSYNFDLSVLPALFLLVSRCRDRILRRATIRLLASFHREGTWDSLAIARVGSWIMGIEERGVETEHIPNHRRARMTRCHVDFACPQGADEVLSAG
jgi:hypothetical protein